MLKCLDTIQSDRHIAWIVQFRLEPLFRVIVQFYLKEKVLKIK